MISIKNVRFGYNSRQVVLDDFSLEFTQGASMACWARTEQARVHYYI